MFTVVVCNGSVDKILYQFTCSSWSIHLIENLPTSCYPVPVSQLDFTSERINQSQTNNKEVEQLWRKLINFLSNEFINLRKWIDTIFHQHYTTATTVKSSNCLIAHYIFSKILKNLNSIHEMWPITYLINYWIQS